MVGLPPGKSAAVPRTALCLGNKLVTGRTGREGAFRRIAARRAPDAAEYTKLTLALVRATGCNSKPIPPSGMNHGGDNQGADLCTGRSISFKIPNKRPRGSAPIRYRWSNSIPATPNCFAPIRSALFRPAAQGRPRALLQGQHVRAI